MAAGGVLGTAVGLLVSIGPVASAQAAVGHVVQPGETLWGIAAANDLTTRTVAVFNGIPEDAMVIAGETIQVPTVDEGAVALASAGVAAAPATTAAAPATAAPQPGLTYVWSPAGSVPLDAAAAASFEQMRQASLAQFGVDLYPDGLLSGYRTYAQQAYLYDLFLSGAGAPANPPGTSSHEYGTAVDLAEPVMRDIVDQIGGAYGWAGTIPSEWWHIAYVGG
jgi:LAS superfamily LD-carboxypeptidase LdcB